MNQLNKHGTIPQIINDSEKSVEHPILPLIGYEILGAMYQSFRIYDALKKVVLSSVKSSVLIDSVRN